MLCLSASQAAAQSADDLAKQTQNPIASLISVPLQGNWDFGLGDRDATGTLLNFQPVMPFAVSPSTNVDPARHHAADVPARLRRTRDQRNGRHPRDGVLLAVEGRADHLGRRSGRSAPRRDEQRARHGEVRRGSVGGRADAAWQVDDRRAVQSHLVDERRQRPQDVNQTFLQPFANYNLGGGLAVGASMEASANWEADETWTAPLLFSVSKVTLLGKRPVNLAVAAGPMHRQPGRRRQLAVSPGGDVSLSTMNVPRISRCWRRRRA